MIVILDFETPSFLLRCHPEQREGSPACLEGSGRCFTYVQHDRYRLHPSVFGRECGAPRSCSILRLLMGFRSSQDVKERWIGVVPAIGVRRDGVSRACGGFLFPGVGKPPFRVSECILSGCRNVSFPGAGMYPFRVSECILSGCRNVSFPDAGIYPKVPCPLSSSSSLPPVAGGCVPM